MWKYLVVNAKGQFGTASRYSVNDWHDKPSWDFGQPVAYARVPWLKFNEPSADTARK